MSDYQIVVPLRIEAKYLKEAKQVTPALADFSKLPWNNGEEDLNFSQPYISDGIVHEPFESGFLLNQGLHLHFILPHFLGKQYAGSATGTSPPPKKMPAAPNRWLITKSGLGANEQWLVQSDFIFDPSTPPEVASSIIPSKRPEGTSATAPWQPYRYMGKSVIFPDAKVADPIVNNSFKKQNTSNQPLTVVGYGDIKFSAFYPNCLSVFGFNDPNLSAASLPDGTITYQVIGWVAEAEDDFLTSTVTNLVNKLQNETDPPVATTKVPHPLLTALNKELNKLCGVQIEGLPQVTGNSISGQTLYFGKMEVEVKSGAITPSKGPKSLKLAVGNTGTEALSALLADQLSEVSTNLPSGGSAETAKSQIEDQLESILMLSKIDHLQVDVGAKFQEARHEKGFRASHSGHLWKVKEDHNNSIEDAKDIAVPPLPSQITALLNDLNVAQVAYDKAHHEVITLQQQLYSDWVKYMNARYPLSEGRGEYPDADHIQYFLENYSFIELTNLANSTGVVTYEKNEAGYPQPTTQSPTAALLANGLIEAWTNVDNYIQTVNLQRVAKSQPALFVIMVAGPRFWEPKAPTVLFSGLTAETNPKSIITCQAIAATPGVNLVQSQTEAIDLSSFLTSLDASDYTFALGDQNWNPFILDWAVDLEDTDLRTSSGSFNPDAVSTNFDFNISGPDTQKSSSYTEGNLSVFSGSVLMSGHAKDAIQKNITKFFIATFSKEKIPFTTGKCLGSFLPFKIPTSWSISSTANTAAIAAATWSDALAVLDLSSVPSSNDKFVTAFQVADITNPYFTAWTACQQASLDQVISQTLDGFNEACLMMKKIPQFPIDEPIGFHYEKLFSAQVKSFVQSQNLASPITAFDFNPIRSGTMTLDRLSLIDNFGEAHLLTPTELAPVISDTLLGTNNDAFLSPRLNQPARLNLRWHSAESIVGQPAGSSIDTNDGSESSPVCGWMMGNYINKEITVYDADGAALGYIGDSPEGSTTTVEWYLPPWSNEVCDPTLNIENIHLYNLVNQIITFTNKTDNSFFKNVLTATEQALDNIAPSTSNIYSIKSILMGRPMAVVRCRTSFELKGKPALSQSWSSILSDLTNCNAQPSWTYDDRNNDDWTGVQLPCKLGEYKQLNDGLVGYWTENSEGQLNSMLYTPEIKSSDIGDANIDGISSSQIFPTQWLSLKDGPMNLTMLMDPRGLLHATTGILPTKAISIPTEHYLPAMKKIEMWFKTSPLLQAATTDNKTVAVNVPPIPGYGWQWWDPYQGSIKVSKVDHTAHDHNGSKLIEGWLSLVPEENQSNN